MEMYICRKFATDNGQFYPNYIDIVRALIKKKPQCEWSWFVYFILLYKTL